MGHEKILVVGATGHLGKFVAEASAELGHPTFALVRPGTLAGPAKAATLASLKKAGVQLLEGSLEDHHSLIEALKQVDVVICVVGGGQVHFKDQVKLVSAIKEVGHIKRFVPSEFGNDPHKTHILPQSEALFRDKIQVQEATKDAGIPHTLVYSNAFGGMLLSTLGQPHQPGQPSGPDKVRPIYGHGKVYLVDEKDIAAYTVKAAVDPRAENKALHIRPAHNLYSHAELVELWEKRTGSRTPTIQLEEEDVLKLVQESPAPYSTMLAIIYSIFIKGDQSRFEVPHNALEATQLYPDVHYTTVDKILDRLL